MTDFTAILEETPSSSLDPDLPRFSITPYDADSDDEVECSRARLPAQNDDDDEDNNIVVARGRRSTAGPSPVSTSEWDGNERDDEHTENEDSGDDEDTEDIANRRMRMQPIPSSHLTTEVNITLSDNAKSAFPVTVTPSSAAVGKKSSAVTVADDDDVEASFIQCSKPPCTKKTLVSCLSSRSTSPGPLSPLLSDEDFACSATDASETSSRRYSSSSHSPLAPRVRFKRGCVITEVNLTWAPTSYDRAPIDVAQSLDIKRVHSIDCNGEDADADDGRWVSYLEGAVAAPPSPPLASSPCTAAHTAFAYASTLGSMPSEDRPVTDPAASDRSVGSPTTMTMPLSTANLSTADRAHDDLSPTPTLLQDDASSGDDSDECYWLARSSFYQGHCSFGAAARDIMCGSSAGFTGHADIPQFSGYAASASSASSSRSPTPSHDGSEDEPSRRNAERDEEDEEYSPFTSNDTSEDLAHTPSISKSFFPPFPVSHSGMLPSGPSHYSDFLTRYNHQPEDNSTAVPTMHLDIPENANASDFHHDVQQEPGSMTPKATKRDTPCYDSSPDNSDLSNMIRGDSSHAIRPEDEEWEPLPGPARKATKYSRCGPVSASKYASRFASEDLFDCDALGGF